MYSIHIPNQQTLNGCWQHQMSTAKWTASGPVHEKQHMHEQAWVLQHSLSSLRILGNFRTRLATGTPSVASAGNFLSLQNASGGCIYPTIFINARPACTLWPLHATDFLVLLKKRGMIFEALAIAIRFENLREEKKISWASKKSLDWENQKTWFLSWLHY